MHFTSFRWNYALNTKEWVGLRFYGPEQNLGPFQAGAIRRCTLKQIVQHVANKRELAAVLVGEANRLSQGKDGENLIIEDVNHWLMSARGCEFSLNREELVSAIDRLDAMDLETVDFEHIVDEINAMLKGAETLFTIPPDGAVYSRARRNLAGRPEYVADLFAPPGQAITRFQRCNAPGVPMLYCSDNVQAALREVGTEVGETVYVSMWAVCQPFATFSMPPGKAPMQNVDAFTVLASYINSKFTEPIDEAQSARYKITAAFARLYAPGRLDPGNPHVRYPMAGVYYRSVPFPGAENIAIEATQAAQSMSFYAAFELNITGELDDGGFNFEVFATCKSNVHRPPLDHQTAIEWREDDQRGKQLLSMLPVVVPVATHFDEERMIFPDLFDGR